MHEARTDSERLEAIEQQLSLVNQNLMAVVVQLSRLYDIEAVNFFGARGDEAARLLEGHEDGHIFTTAPVLKSFGVPEPQEEDSQEED